MDSIKIVGFTGSLRKGSYNKAALRAAGELLPQGVSLEILDLSQIPFFPDLRDEVIFGEYFLNNFGDIFQLE